VATPANFPPLTPVELVNDPTGSGATMAAEQDVTIAENLIAADAETLVAPGAGAVAQTVRPARRSPRLLWVHEHLHHLSERAHTISGPAMRVAQLRQTPWWR
jgi:hypothetical protein